MTKPLSEFPVIVTGHRDLGDSFSVTLSEGNPRFILYDPPGGNSYSELLAGVELNTGVTVSRSKVESLIWITVS
jgi:hypothetical protein